MCVSVKGQEEDYVYFNLVVNVGWAKFIHVKHIYAPKPSVVTHNNRTVCVHGVIAVRSTSLLLYYLI